MKNKEGYITEEVTKSKKHKSQILLSIVLFSVGAFLIVSSLGIFGGTFIKASSNSNFSKVVNFDSSNVEYKYSYDKIKSDFRNVNFVKGLSRLFIKEDSLWIQYPTEKSGVEDSGAMINSEIKSSNEYTLEYEIFFDGCGNPFDYQDGGVLSGLAGGKFYDGSEKEMREEGFHAMLTYNNYGYLYPLVYSTADKNVDGMLFQNIGRINDYTWNKIRMYVRINDKGQDNGIFRVWLNDNLCFNNETITYTNCYQKINISNLCVYNNVTNKMLNSEQFVYIDNYRIIDQNE